MAENLEDDSIMLCLVICFCVDHQIIDADHYHVIHICENFIHHHLECGGGVAKSEIHDQRFECSTQAKE